MNEQIRAEFEQEFPVPEGIERAPEGKYYPYQPANGSVDADEWDRAIAYCGMHAAWKRAHAKYAGSGGAWSGWACRYPGKMPRLYGAREIAEVNCYSENGDQLIFLSTHPPSTAQELRNAFDEGCRASGCRGDTSFRWESSKAAQIVSQPTAQEDSPTKGMSLGERIAHVGGRENEAGYTEFGSVMAVKALIDHVLRDIDRPSQPTAQGVEHLMELIGEYFELGVAEGAEGRDHDTEDHAAQRKLEQIESALSGMVMVPVEPSRGLLVSMAMRNDHGFGLLSGDRQESILGGMRQIHEEVVGTGFYNPGRESEYLETLKAASKGE